jgi:hypothetical protein
MDLEDDNLSEARKFIHRLVEDLVQPIGGFRDAQRSNGDLQPNNSKFREDEAFESPKQPWTIITNAIDEVRNSTDDLATMRKCGRAMNALRNVYTCMRNIDYITDNDLPADFGNYKEALANAKNFTVDDANMLYDICDDQLNEIIEVLNKEWSIVVNFVEKYGLDCQDQLARLKYETYSNKAVNLETIADKIYRLNGRFYQS